MANNLLIPDNIDAALSSNQPSPSISGPSNSKLVIPDNIDEALKNHSSQIPNNYVPVAPISNTSQIQPSNDTIIGRLSQAKDYIQSGAYAALKGVAQGSSDILSTVDKAVVKGLGYIPGLKGKIPNASDIQSGYNYYTDKYNKDADTNAHPLMSGAGRMTGQVAMTAPLGALAGGGAVAADAASQLGLGLAGQTTARVIGSAGTNALQGMAQGGLTNTANQGSDVINQQGAQTGALFGGTLGAIGSGVLGSYGKNLQNYQNFSQDLSKAGYKGPVFSTDVPANQGVWEGIKSAIVNNVIAKIPGVTNIPGIGIQSARDEQALGIQNAIKIMADKFADAKPGTTQLQFSNAIQKAKASGEEAIASASNNFRSKLDVLGINDHPLTITKPIIDNILASDKISPFLNKGTRQALTDTGDIASTDVLLGSKGQAGLNKIIWTEHQRLAGDPTNRILDDGSKQLYDAYHAIQTDLHNSMGQDTDAIEAFHKFNTITTGIRSLWSKDNSPVLAKAFSDIHADANGMMQLFNRLQKGSLSPQAQANVAGVMGQKAVQPVGDNLLNKIFTSNVQNGKFNVSGLLDAVEKAPAGLIPKDVHESLKGLASFAQKSSPDATAPTTQSVANQIGLGTALGGAAAVSNTARIILGTGAALGAITAHAPIKNTLMWVNKTAGKTADGNLSQFLIDKASKYFTRLGVSFITNPDGNIEIKKESEDTKPKTPNPTLGTYD